MTSRNKLCASYQGAYCLVRDTVADQIITVMYVLFQAEKRVPKEGDTVCWHGLGKSRKCFPGSGALGEMHSVRHCGLPVHWPCGWRVCRGPKRTRRKPVYAELSAGEERQTSIYLTLQDFLGVNVCILRKTWKEGLIQPGTT